MIISKDYKKAFISNPKTGTRSAISILGPYGTVWKNHPNIQTGLLMASTKIEGFTPSMIEKIYVFWRDPVERFISSINYFRSPHGVLFLIKNKPEWFSGLVDEIDYMNWVPSSEILNRAKTITPEQIFYDPNLMFRNEIFNKQSRWIDNSNELLTVYNYSNFTESMASIAVEFGANNSSLIIPKLNEGIKLTTTLSTELTKAVKDYYAEDYLLKPV